MFPAVWTNISNSSGVPCQPEKLHDSIPVLLCLVFVVGFLLNSFSLWVFCCRLSSWTCSTTLQFHLALSDAIASPVAPMVATYFALGHQWPFGDMMCRVKVALLSSHFLGSSAFLALISVQRYAAVVHFNRRSCLKRKQFVGRLCAGVWALLGVQALVLVFLLPSSREGQHYQCLSIRQTNLTKTYFVINFLLLVFEFLIPFAVAVVCYGRLADTLTRLNISTAKGLKVKVKSQRMISVCLLIFLVSFLPLNAVRTAAVVLKRFYPGRCGALQQMETAYYVSWILAGVNSCLDPLLYCFGSQKFRDAFGSLKKRQNDAPNRSDSEMTPNNNNNNLTI